MKEITICHNNIKLLKTSDRVQEDFWKERTRERNPEFCVNLYKL